MYFLDRILAQQLRYSSHDTSVMNDIEFEYILL